MLKMLGAITCVCVAWIMGACNTSGCTDNRSAIPLAEFYSSSTLGTVTLDSLQIHGIGAPGDSVLLAAGQSVSQVYLPMRADRQTTAWCLSYKLRDLDHEALNDTVTLKYDSRPWFATDDCGAMYRYYIQDVVYTRHMIDSVAITDPDITNQDRVSIKFYFRTTERPADARPLSSMPCRL